MNKLRKHLPDELYDSGRETVEGMGYLGSEHVLLQYSYACNSVDHGQTPCVLYANRDSYRAVALDRTGDRSKLWQEVHSDVARSGRKAHHVSKKSLFWERGRPNCGVLQDAEETIARIAALHVHFRGADASALISFEQWGVETTLQRPPQMSEVFPPTITFTPQPPPQLEELGVEGAKAAVRAAIAELEADEPGPLQLDVPRYIGSDRAGVKQAEEDYDEFCRRHYRAYVAFKSGRRNVVFPAGTVFWRCRANVKVEVSAAR